ncbi:MAG: hypothetical protein L6R00_16235 [Phycisphaerae bacterium]|nr:hypothetical protein [Phycisphaerae bacterium]
MNDPAAFLEAAVCPRCGTRGMSQQHCKVWCERCGYVESCEDVCLTAPTRPATTPPVRQAPVGSSEPRP